MGKLISIVIPCYNEEKTINIICEAIQKTMEQVDDMEYELLLVNDGSSDERQFMQDYVMQRVTMLLQWMLICRIHQNCCQRC